MKWSEVKVSQSCPTLCDPMDCIVYGILQAKILEWVAIPFSRGSSQPRSQTQVSHLAGGFFTSWATREAHGNTQTSDLRMFICSPVYHGEKLKTTSCPKTRYWLEREKSLSHVWLFETPWTIAYQAPLSMGFFRQEYWSGLPFPSPGDLPDPEIKPRSPTLQADALPSEPPRKPLVLVK